MKRLLQLMVVLGIVSTTSLADTQQAADGVRADSRRPNIILILADNLGWGDLGCYGQKRIRTPEIDALAAQGMRFTDFYAGATVCAPSRCVLMTGLHTGHARIRGNTLLPLEPQDRTVAALLQQAGYTTALIGKWGLGEENSTGLPNRQGFDYFFGYLNQMHAHNYYPKFLWRNQEKVYLKNKVVYVQPGPLQETFGGVASEPVEYSHDLFTREALDFVKRSATQPFFLYLAYTMPHPNCEYELLHHPHGMEVPDLGPYAGLDWPEVQKAHAAMITRMDTDIGRLMRLLDELNLEQDTIVLFTSDNGPQREGGNEPEFNDSNGPLRGIIRDLYEGGIRVPLVVRWPGHVPAGTVSDTVGYFPDFLPTAAELAGVRPPDHLDGISLLPTLLGRPQKMRERFLYWEFYEHGFQQAVRWGPWKYLLLGADRPPELYNLSEDIGETRNVCAEHPDVVEKIEQYLKGARTESADWQKLSAPFTLKSQTKPGG